MKASKWILVFSVLIAATVSTSCEKIKGRGPVVTEMRSVNGFNTIDLAMDATVYYTPDSVFSCSVEAQENLTGYIQTHQDGDRLVIRVKPGVILGPHDPIVVRISAPGVNDLRVSGSGDFNVLNTWAGQQLSASISGSGKVYISYIDAISFDARISGSGDVKVVSGYADNEEFQISGSGNIDLRQVIAVTTVATISGSGNIYTQVTSLLDGTISGSGSIYYLGQPSVNARISGSGKIVRL